MIGGKEGILSVVYRVPLEKVVFNPYIRRILYILNNDYL